MYVKIETKIKRTLEERFNNFYLSIFLLSRNLFFGRRNSENSTAHFRFFAVEWNRRESFLKCSNLLSWLSFSWIRSPWRPQIKASKVLFLLRLDSNRLSNDGDLQEVQNHKWLIHKPPWSPELKHWREEKCRCKAANCNERDRADKAGTLCSWQKHDLMRTFHILAIYTRR